MAGGGFEESEQLRQRYRLAPTEEHRQALALALFSQAQSLADNPDELALALPLWDELARLCPEQSDVLHGKASALWRGERLEQAAECIADNLRRFPHHQLSQGLAAILKALLEADPTPVLAHFDHQRYPGLHFNRAMAYLAVGDFERGLVEYEAGLEGDPPRRSTHLRPYSQSLWRGEPLHGKSLWVWSEQGFGDQIMCARLLSSLCDQAAEVTVEGAPALVPLLQQLDPRLKVLPLGLEPPQFDYHVPIMSLWLRTHARADTLRASFKPYVQRPRLDPPLASNFSVGLQWRSGEKAEALGRRSAARKSLPLSDFLWLARWRNTTVVLLDKSLTEAELALAREHWPQLLVQAPQDFLHAADTVSQLDLVISVDTAIAHLAAACGTPTWVLVRYDGYWPWIYSEGHRAVWYPTVMRLFRQSAYRNWDGVMAKVEHAFATVRHWQGSDG